MLGLLSLLRRARRAGVPVMTLAELLDERLHDQDGGS
jgi:hypothetical protein